MPRGRPPKPTRQKELEGNPGKRPLTQDDIDPEKLTVAPKPPTTLTGKLAIAEWKLMAGHLTSLGMLTEMDLQALACYCSAVQTYWNAIAVLDKQGTTVTVYEKPDKGSKSKGEQTVRYMAQRPEVSIARQAAKQIKEFGALLGFSPSDRARLKVNSPLKGQDDPLVAFAKKRSGNG